MDDFRRLLSTIKKLDSVKKELGKFDSFYQYFPPNPPATMDEVKRLEQYLEVPLPEEFKNLLLICNGWRNLVAKIDLLSVDEIMDDLGRDLIELDIEENGGPIIEGIDFRKVVPFGIGFDQADGKDMFLLHLLSPDEYEVIWWHFYVVGEKRKSIVEFLDDILIDLSNQLENYRKEDIYEKRDF